MTIDLVGLRKSLDAESVVITSLSEVTRINWMVGSKLYRLGWDPLAAESLTQEEITHQMMEVMF